MQKLYSVFDVKVGTFGNPFCALSDGAAVRMVLDAAQDSSTLISRHPEDFVIYCVGRFDEDGGDVSGVNPVNLGNVKALVVATTEKLNHVAQ